MASIYDKALKRKDFSGVVSSRNKEEASPPETGAQPAQQDAADVGKIVQLCSGDANVISVLFSMLFVVYVRVYLLRR